jgi:hypothetical protein
MIKKAIIFALDKLGYRLIRNSVQLVPQYHHRFTLNKYQSLIESYGKLLRTSMLPTLPQISAERKVLISNLLGLSVTHAMFLIDCLHKVLHCEGDICEFGVAQGATSALLANEIINTTKRLWLFDSFEGLPKPTEKDELKDDIFNLGSIEQYEGTMKCSMDMVTTRLAEIDFPMQRVEIVPGFIEHTLKAHRLPTEVLFAFVDFDLYQPIKVTLEFLDKVLVENGIIIVHDYDYFSTGVKTVVDEFLSTRGYQYSISFPDSFIQGICMMQKHAEPVSMDKSNVVNE